MYLCLLVSCCVFSTANAIVAGGATNATGEEWTPITFGEVSDLFPDRDSGGASLDENEIVGDATYSGFYVNFDEGVVSDASDGTSFFRLRVSGLKNVNKGYQGITYIGLDLDGDSALDFFVKATANTISLVTATGTNRNSPLVTASTTAFSVNGETFSAPTDSGNFSLATVASIDGTPSDLDNNNGDDYFISFAVDFDWIVEAANSLAGVTNFDETQGIGYVVSTSSKNDRFDADIAGVDGGIDSSSTFAALGAIADPVTAGGTAVPESSAYALLLGFVTGATVLLRRRR